LFEYERGELGKAVSIRLVPGAWRPTANGFADSMGIFAHDLENYLKELKQEAVAHLQGIQKGRVEGVELGRAQERAMRVQERTKAVREMVQAKFGEEVAAQLKDTYPRLTTEAKLASFLTWVVQCSSAEELFERIRGSANGIN